MKRVDWLNRLWATVDACKGLDFAWGQHDCCLFAARCVDAMTDGVWVKVLRAEYSDRLGGLRFIARHGNLEEATSHYLGRPQAMARTKRGDVCLVPTQGAPGLGICVGHTVAVACEKGADGLGVTFYPYRLIEKSWLV